MRLYSLKFKRILFERKAYVLIVLLILGNIAFAQEGEKESHYLKNKLSQIDSLIQIKEFEKANYLIENTLNTFAFKNNLEDKLTFELKSAQILYERGDAEGAIKKLLINFEKLKSRPFASLSIDYAAYLARIFANSQNFDKAIYYNKMALNKSKLLKDTVNTTISLIRIGSFYYAKKQIDSAKYYFKRVTYFPVNDKTEVRIAMLIII